MKSYERIYWKFKDLVTKNAELKEDVNKFMYIESGYDILTIKRYFPKRLTEEMGGIDNLIDYCVSNLAQLGYVLTHENNDGGSFQKENSIIIFTYTQQNVTLAICIGEPNTVLYMKVLDRVNKCHKKMITDNVKRYE